ncbi:MAG: hypothetical protein ACI80V_003092 [Rhodothermales bacterium]|jgi:hypothetical protein
MLFLWPASLTLQDSRTLAFPAPMTMIKTTNRTVAALLLISAISSVGSATAQEFNGLVTGVSASEAEVRFSVKPGFESVTLVVVGPDEFLSENVFPEGEEPTFPVPPAGLTDGSYTYELKGAIKLSATTRSQLLAARAEGDRMLIAAIFSDAGIDPSSAIESGHFGVSKGKFVVTEEEPQPDAKESQTGLGSGSSSTGLRNTPSSSQSASGDDRWLEASISSSNADGSVSNYRGYVLPPESDRGSDGQYLRAYFRLMDNGSEPGPWVRGYFQSKEGSFNFIDQSNFNAAGLRSAVATPFDYMTAAVEPLPPPSVRDQLIQDDLIVTGSICAGFDCVNGESFGFDTIRLKENNLRIRFQDTSNSSSFPTRDWELTINDSANGGASYFAVSDSDGGRVPLKIIGGAPSNSLYVDAAGRVGLGTATPIVEIHVLDGDSPTLRLQQDGSSGFGTQTWDIAGNETNFFIRDASNGSKLPFRIIPDAPSNSIYVAASGAIGFGTSSPAGAGTITVNPGNAAVPAVKFNGDPDTGMFQIGADQLGFATGGIQRVSIGSDGALTIPAGSAAVPAINFTGDTDTGLFWESDGVVKLSVNGTATALGGSSSFADGSAAAPGIAFTDDPNTGIYRIGADQIGIATGGTLAATVDASQNVTFAGSATVAAAVNAGSLGLGGAAISTVLTVAQFSPTDPIADAWTTYSSRRWKSDIRTLENALQTVERLRGVSYTWKGNGKADIGLIAEEVGAVIPEIVVFEENGVDASSVDYARIVAVLIEAVKQQQAMIEARDTEIAGLSTRVGSLEASITDIQRMLASSQTSSRQDQ